MSTIYDFLADKDEQLQAAWRAKEAGWLGAAMDAGKSLLGTVGAQAAKIPGAGIAKGVWNNKGKLLGAGLTASEIAGGAKQTQQIASHLAPRVAAAPMNVGPIF